MKKIVFPDTTGYSDKPKVISLGKFHTFHLGHQDIFKNSKSLAKQKDYEFIIMLFSEKERKHISDFSERLELSNLFRPDYIMEFELKKENFEITSTEFEEILKKMNVKEIFCGNDFRYGKNREGSIESLSKEFSVNVIDNVLFDGKKLSTSIVYEAMKQMDLVLFTELTGRYFSYEGEVIRGLGNGKKFGMPTANIEYPMHKIDIEDGIFFSYATYDGDKYSSLTSISSNPTLNAEHKTYETFLYNFDKEIYGETIKVELIKKYRDPIKFNGIEKLIEKLEEDKKLGKTFFKL